MGPQNLFAPGGPQAEQLLDLWWVMIVVCGAVFLAVLISFLLALWRAGRGTAATPPDLSSLERPESGARVAVTAAIAVSAAGLVFLIVASFMTDRALARLAPADLQVDVTGHQWWWELQYNDPAEPAKNFTTANELHIPVGRTVLLRLRADDVIHSFWVPNLAGKKDLIPGRNSTLALRADRVGVYRGQCAEFCGLQHAKMAFLVVAEPPEKYEAWAAAQRKPAAEPADAQQKRGRELFVTGRCGMCHAIQGSAAGGHRAPDLTHLSSRNTIAAGLLPNTVGHLAGWILDPQGIKPGVNMPSNPMPPDDLYALLAYLGSLK
ncbi:MAG TPA: cytochrome c oxidase subunit II [Burkholderiales bacterium]|nr:cytochrome c oxidase subunit II [Burkholderiales bacterium]